MRIKGFQRLPMCNYAIAKYYLGVGLIFKNRPRALAGMSISPKDAKLQPARFDSGRIGEVLRTVSRNVL